MSKLSNEEFQAYLKQIRRLAEGPLEEIQNEVEVTNKFPQEFYDLAIQNDLYRCSLPAEYGGYGLNELEILQVQEEFSRGPGGMRMHLHYAMDLNWRILDDYGNEEVKAEYMPKFQNKEVFTCFALTEATGGTGADLHTTAVRDGDSYLLNGEKTLISHTDCCEFAYVIAVTNPDSDKNDRLSAFFVPMDAPGFEVINMPHMMGPAREYQSPGTGAKKWTEIEKTYLCPNNYFSSRVRSLLQQWLVRGRRRYAGRRICNFPRWRR